MQTHTAAPTDLGGGNPAFSDKIQREYLSGATSVPKTMSVGGVKLHAGAVRFYREIGVKIPAGLIPPEAR